MAAEEAQQAQNDVLLLGYHAYEQQEMEEAQDVPRLEGPSVPLMLGYADSGLEVLD